MPSRTEFQQLADVRVTEAAALLGAGLWDGAYYVAGYAVECALKACIAKLTKAEEFPPPRKFIEQCYSHDLNQLTAIAELEPFRVAEIAADPQFSRYWDVVKRWNEATRYVRTAEADARSLYNAITDPAHGVLAWVKRHW